MARESDLTEEDFLIEVDALSTELKAVTLALRLLIGRLAARGVLTVEDGRMIRSELARMMGAVNEASNVRPETSETESHAKVDAVLFGSLDAAGRPRGPAPRPGENYPGHARNPNPRPRGR